MNWKDTLKTAGKFGLKAVLWLLLFPLWIVSHIAEVQLRDLNRHLKRFLFPNRI